MTTAARSIFVLLSTFSCLIAPVVTRADEPQYALGINGNYIDPKLSWLAVSSSTRVPINRKYKDLTKQQRDAVKEAYEPMPEDDEPPFPEDGLEPILRALLEIRNFVQLTGTLNLSVEVGADGVATAISIQGSPTRGMTRFVSEYFLLTKYKPAICGGKPCKMQYAFTLVVDRD